MRRWLLAWWMVASAAAQAVTVGGVELPDTWRLDEQTLELNGAGVREYGFFNSAVYAAALYLPARERSAAVILDAASPKVVQMRMLRSASREDSAKAWDVYLAANCAPPCVIDPQARATFLALIPETRAGDTQTFVFRAGRVEVLRNGTPVGAIEHAAFARLVLTCWIGAKPTTEALKRALLGGD